MKKKKYIIGFFIVISALLALLFTSFRSSLQYYVSVSELRADVHRYEDKILKVAGKASNIQQTEENGRLAYRFGVDEGGAHLDVLYVGLVPDTFHNGADVVVTGSLNAQGQFVATEILAKCASKYEAKLEQ